MISGDFGNILANGKEGVNEWGKVRKIYGRKVLPYAARTLLVLSVCIQGICLEIFFLVYKAEGDGGEEGQVGEEQRNAHKTYGFAGSDAADHTAGLG